MFEIAGRALGTAYKPYIIAEMSANHGGSIERAKRTILAAKVAGASAVKMQTYTPDTMTIDSDLPDFQIDTGLWAGTSLYNLYLTAHTPFEWHEELFDFSRAHGLTLFSTPFDETAVELLERVNTPAYKIASFELTDLPLIECAASTGKPILISTGMSSLADIGEAVETCKRVGNDDVLLLHCISSYPASVETSCLSNMKILAKEFRTLVGLSDHTVENVASIAAIAMGASAIEKHFKLDNEDCGPDSSFSVLPSQFGELVRDCDSVHAAVAESDFRRSEEEAGNMRFRRSLYFVRDMKAGEKVDLHSIRRIRPGFGLAPKFLEAVQGRTLKESVKKGEPVKWEDFES
ncbi:pseudaminic acid synthase [Luminiphilus sp.]|nr:pseudaminic acid synthase [Luminiphilus sp.]